MREARISEKKATSLSIKMPKIRLPAATCNRKRMNKPDISRFQGPFWHTSPYTSPAKEKLMLLLSAAGRVSSEKR